MKGICVTLLGAVLLAFSNFYSCEAATMVGAQNNTLRIMYLIPWSHEWGVGPNMGSAVQVAIDAVDSQQLLPDYSLEFIYRDTWCKSSRGVEMALEMWAEMIDVDFMLGDGCSVICQPTGLLSGAWNVPQISYACAAGPLSNKNIYPTFARTIGPWTLLAPMFDAIADTWNHTRVGVITEPADLMQFTAEEIKNYLELHNKKVYYNVLESTAAGSETIMENYEVLKDRMKYLKDNCRAIFIITYGNDVRNTLIAAYELGMLNGDYMFVGMEVAPIVNEPARSGWLYPDFGASLFNGLLIGTPSEPTGAAYDTFRQDIIDAFQDPVWDGMNKLAADADFHDVDSYAALTYDALLLWAHGVNKTLQDGGLPDDGVTIANNIFNSYFNGMTGEVSIDSQGDRLLNYKIEMPQEGNLTIVGQWMAREQYIEKVYKPNDAFDWSGLMWGGNATTPPKSVPDCGWENELCVVVDTSFPTYAIAIIAIVVIVLIGLGLFLGYRHLKYQNDLKEATQCCVSWSQVNMEDEQAAAKSRMSMISRASVRGQRFVEIAKFRDDLVAVKKLGSISVDVNNMEIRLELKNMRAISHDNLNQFLGIVVSSPNACILMAYCNKGSLQDVLNDESVKLTWDFKLSLTNDLSRGLHFIHNSNLQYHGHLNSSNCLIDNRWTCKITDYGFHKVQSMSTLKLEENILNERKIWVAPEVLRKQSTPNKMADTYAFAIICQEIVLEGSPYCRNSDEPVATEVIDNVTDHRRPPYRPTLPSDLVGPEWRDMITRCWDELPENRPAMAQVQGMIRAINGGKSINLVDNMINMLEKHTRNLEEIVEQRSKELHDEKAKMEILLLELLPKSVAENLKLGKQAAPETFEVITLYFSDIVGFTAISAQSTPIQIVNMLNRMYTLFDEVSSKFDVYKVATIGDAYMVSSGVPIRNGTRHASEISFMAMGLLEAVGDFKVEHLPGQSLRLRAGIHTGGVVAGVAGVKMPRYLLFGDTVDQASKMESSGEPMRIHISQTTEALLDKSVFDIEFRHEMEVKGFGVMKTYWINGLK